MPSGHNHSQPNAPKFELSTEDQASIDAVLRDAIPIIECTAYPADHSTMIISDAAFGDCNDSAISLSISERQGQYRSGEINFLYNGEDRTRDFHARNNEAHRHRWRNQIASGPETFSSKALMQRLGRNWPIDSNNDAAFTATLKKAESLYQSTEDLTPSEITTLLKNYLTTMNPFTAEHHHRWEKIFDPYDDPAVGPIRTLEIHASSREGSGILTASAQFIVPEKIGCYSNEVAYIVESNAMGSVAISAVLREHLSLSHDGRRIHFQQPRDIDVSLLTERLSAALGHLARP